MPATLWNKSLLKSFGSDACLARACQKIFFNVVLPCPPMRGPSCPLESRPTMTRRWWVRNPCFVSCRASTRNGPIAWRPDNGNCRPSASTFLDLNWWANWGTALFGRVYLARQDDLAHRFVAVKITPHLSDEPQCLAQLQHTNIVPIYSVHRHGSLQAICMPFLGPNTLADVVKTVEVAQALPHSGKAIVSTIAVRQSSTLLGDALPEMHAKQPGEEIAVGRELPEAEAIRHLNGMSYQDAAVWIMRRVADGLAFAHEHGVIHRDLKPGNILLTDDGEPLILDFNLATQHATVGQAVAIIGGTLPYISPEQLFALRNGGRVGVASDIYSFGVILFQLLTGHLPYPVRTGSFEDVVVQMLDDRRVSAPSPRELNPTVSPGLQAIVDKCLRRDPLERYENTRHLQEDLQRHLEHRPLLHVPNRSLLERTRKWTRRHPRLSSAYSVALASGLVIAALLMAAWSLHTRLERGRAGGRPTIPPATR